MLCSYGTLRKGKKWEAIGLGYASGAGDAPLPQPGKRSHKVAKEHAQGHAVKRWQNQDAAELSSATAVAPEQTSSSQQDNSDAINKHWGVFLKVRNFWSLEIPHLRDKSLHFTKTAATTPHWETHIEHSSHTQLRKTQTVNANYRTPPPHRHRCIINSIQRTQIQYRHHADRHTSQPRAQRAPGLPFTEYRNQSTTTQ